MRMMPRWLLLMLLMLLMLLLTEDLVLPMVNIPRPMADGACAEVGGFTPDDRTSSARGGCRARVRGGATGRADDGSGRRIAATGGFTPGDHSRGRT